MHRVLCIDDSRTFRELIEVVLDREPEMTCAGQASDVTAAVELLDHGGVDADVVIMDTGLAGPDGIEGIRRIKRLRPGIRVVVLASRPDLDLLVRSASVGADAFLAKDCSLSELLDALRRNAGRLELDSATIDAVRQSIQDEGHVGGLTWDPRLTDREKDVLGLMAEGLDPQSIARHLQITVHTSRSYVRNVLTKLGAHTQLEAVITAAKAGMVTGLCNCGHTERRSDMVQAV